MLECTKIGQINENSIYSRFPNTSKVITSAAPTLKIPDLIDIPIAVFPDSQNVPLPVIKQFARILLYIQPSFNKMWKAGNDLGGLIEDISLSIKQAIELYGKQSGLSEIKVSFGDEEGDFNIRVDTFDEVLPIFYTEALEWVKLKTPRMRDIFIEAIKLLGSKMYTWQDFRFEHLDYIENIVIPDLEYDNNSGEEIEYQKKLAEDMNKVGPDNNLFFDRKMTKIELVKFKNKINKFEAVSKNEKLLLKWCEDVAVIVDVPCFEFDEDHYDLHVPFHRLFPILWSRGDVLTEQFGYNLDEYTNSGAWIGVILTYREMENDKDVRLLEKFLGNIRLLGYFENVFRFFKGI